MEVEHYLVLARLDLQCAKNIVDAPEISTLTIDCRCPAGIIDLREDEYASFVRLRLVDEMVGLVAFQGDHRLSVLRHSLSEL